MPATHSKYIGVALEEACSCALCPFKTEIRGPAPTPTGGDDDVIDEVLNTFRSNVLYRNFEIKGSADRTLIYLTLHTVQCLVKLEKFDDKASALREMKSMSLKPFVIPGEPGFVLGGLVQSPQSRAEGDLFKAYFKQAREELSYRLIDRLYNNDGTKNKWWQAFSKRKFMGKELKEF